MNNRSSNPPSSHQPSSRSALIGDLLEEHALSVDELARACRVEPAWVVEHVEAGLLEGAGTVHAREWRFSSTSLTRARRMLHFEQGFDANPELAALAADLIEEVAQLRRRLRAAGLTDR